MTRWARLAAAAALATAAAGAACVGTGPEPAPAVPAGVKAFIGATVIDGTGAAPIAGAVMVVSHGRIDAVGPAGTVEVPAGAERVDLSGRTVMPGIVNAHGHVGGTVGLESGPGLYTADNVLRQLALYARYGVTTVNSLGDDQAAGFEVRDTQGRETLDRARLFAAGPVIDAETPEMARDAVDAVAERNPDFIKIRVDDNLGTATKMAPAIYRAVIDQAHQRQLRVAAHVYYLDDAKALLRAGVDFIAHSVRDKPVDAELVELMKARDACLIPTLTREVSTFVYESRPAFFDDPFFTREADPQVVRQLEDPARQASVAASRAAQQYKKSLPTARHNARALADAGVRIAMGTDSGPPGRFQGFFEHLELEEMMAAGFTPMEVIVAATGGAARCLALGDELGTLRPGLAADFLVLERSPLDDIANTKSLESVWIAGRRIGS